LEFFGKLRKSSFEIVYCGKMRVVLPNDGFVDENLQLEYVTKGFFDKTVNTQVEIIES
jgi:hypothetical protein